MPNLGARGAAGPLPSTFRLQIVSPCSTPPEGEGRLHKIKHDGHRLVAITDGCGALTLLSRRGHDRTPLFREPFAAVANAGRALVLDGEIAVPDERGVTHLDHLTDALTSKRAERLAYFAFDLLHLDGEDLRQRAVEHRKALPQRTIEELASPRVLYVDHVVGRGIDLFTRIDEIGAEGIVSKRLGSIYHGRESRDWLKTKCHQTDRFVVIGFQELGEGRLEAIHVAEERDGELHPVGQVRYGFAGKGWWADLDLLRIGEPRAGLVAVWPVLQAEIKFFGRHKGGAIRDGVIQSLGPAPAPPSSRIHGCDCEETLAAFDAFEALARASGEVGR